MTSAEVTSGKGRKSRQESVLAFDWTSRLSGSRGATNGDPPDLAKITKTANFRFDVDVCSRKGAWPC